MNIPPETKVVSIYDDYMDFYNIEGYWFARIYKVKDLREWSKITRHIRINWKVSPLFTNKNVYKNPELTPNTPLN